MKNVVFIPNINLGNGRSTPYHYSIKSWKKWCESNNAILFEWKDAVLDTKSFPITFQRYLVFDILDKHNIEYGDYNTFQNEVLKHHALYSWSLENKVKFENGEIK